MLGQHLQQTRLGPCMVTIGKPDGGFFKIGFVHEFLRFECGRGRSRGSRRAEGCFDGWGGAGQHGGVRATKTANGHAVIGEQGLYGGFGIQRGG